WRALRENKMSCRLSGIGYRLSAIGYQLSAIGYQLSAFSFELSALSCAYFSWGRCDIKIQYQITFPLTWKTIHLYFFPKNDYFHPTHKSKNEPHEVLPILPLHYAIGSFVLHSSGNLSGQWGSRSPGTLLFPGGSHDPRQSR